MTKISGVYRLRHKPSGSSYVGSSADIYSRWWWHEHMLDEEEHTCSSLQKLWNKDGESAFVFEILELCPKNILRVREDYFANKEKKLLSRTNRGFHHTKETRQKMREGRVRYLKTPGAREDLSNRAKQQHAEGNFGAKTWKRGPRYNPRSGVAGAKALRAHIAAQSSAEMSRRSYMRKIFR